MQAPITGFGWRRNQCAGLRMEYVLPTIKSSEFIEAIGELFEAFVHVHQVKHHCFVFDDVRVQSLADYLHRSGVQDLEDWALVQALPDVVPILRFFRLLICRVNVQHLIVLYVMRVIVGIEVKILNTA